MGVKKDKPKKVENPEAWEVTEAVLQEYSQEFGVPIDWLRDYWEIAKLWYLQKDKEMARPKAVLKTWLLKDRMSGKLKEQTQRQGTRKLDDKVWDI